MTRLAALALIAVFAAGCGGRPATATPTAGAPTVRPTPTATATSGLADNELLVTRDDYGDDWPLTVDEGILSCERGSAVVFTTDGRRYAVNGTAMTLNLGADLDPIWAPDPAGVTPKMNIGPLIGDGLELCD